MDDSTSRPALLSPEPAKASGALEDEEPLRAEDFAPPPPPLVCRPAQEVPPPGLFITWEGLRKYSHLANVAQAQAERPALLAPAPLSSPDSDSESEGVVTSDLHRLRAGASQRAEAAVQAQAGLPAGGAAEPEPELMDAEAAGAAEGNDASMPAAEPPQAEAQEPADAEQGAQQQQEMLHGEGGGKRKRRRMESQPKGKKAAAAEGQQEQQQEQGQEEHGGEQRQEEQQEQLQERQARPERATRETHGSSRTPADGAPRPAADIGAPQHQHTATNTKTRRSARTQGTAATGPAAGQPAVAVPREAAAELAEQAPPPQQQQQQPMQDEAQDEEEAEPAAAEVLEQIANKSLQEAWVQAALRKVGEESWASFAKKLADAAAAAAAASGQGRSQRRLQNVTVNDVLNKHSKVFHAGFAAAYSKAKSKLQKRSVPKIYDKALREHTHLAKAWSELTPEEHAWFLERQGQPVRREDETRMAELREAVAEEQEQWRARMLAAAAERPERYQHCTPRQLAQLDTDAAARRQLLRQQLPRLYRLHSTVGLERARDEGLGRLVLQPVTQLLVQGTPPHVVSPACGTSLPGDRLYLPASVEPSGMQQQQQQQIEGLDVQERRATRASASRGAGGKLSGKASSSVGLYRKVRPLPMADDPAVQELCVQLELQQQQQQQLEEQGEQGLAAVFCLAAAALAAVVSTATAGNSAGWEIPVSVSSVPADDDASCSSSRRVFLDKPLPPRTATMRQRQHSLQKYAWLSAAVQREGGQGGGTSSGLPPRETDYRQFQLGRRSVLVRAHGRMLAPPSGPAKDGSGEAAGDGQQEQQDGGQRQGAGGIAAAGAEESVVLYIKEEYLPEPDREELTRPELAACLNKLQLNQGASSLLLVSIDVTQARVLGCQHMSRSEVVVAAGGPEETAASFGRGARLLDSLLAQLEQLPDGKYLACHAAEEADIALYRALPPDIEVQEGQMVPPLPATAASAKAGGNGQIYDLHAAHARSPELVQPAKGTIVCPKWRQFRPDLPQIPNTFPPKLKPVQGTGGKKGKGGRRGSKGATPHAWKVLGNGGDFDQVEALGGVTEEEYLRGLNEEL